MRFGEKYLTFVLWIFLLCLHCLVYCKSTNGSKTIRKHTNRKVTNDSRGKFTPPKTRDHRGKSSEQSGGSKGLENAVRRDLLGGSLIPGGRIEELPLPDHVEHVKDYPVPVAVKHEIGESILHVHIHDKDPCRNGGFLSRDFQGGYHCVCPTQFTGTTCEEQQFCFSEPCKNGGKCLETDYGYKCQCTKGFSGDNCEDELFCIANPCLHDGKCVETLRGYKCVCQDGFRGTHCKDIDSCYPNPCQHGGTCENINGAARCQCHPGYHGKYCYETYICHVNPCHNGGRCVENPLQPCRCPRGYVGTYCHDHVCHPNPCLHGGACSIVDHPLGSRNNRWTFHCHCSEYYRGRICQIPHPCIDQPCLNGGTCVDTYYTLNGGREQHNAHDVTIPSMNLAFFCNCPPGFSGSRCEIDICSLCHRDADCVNHHCVCKPHFIGDGHYCRNVSSHCHPNPCYHGICSEGPDGSYDCECHPGYCGPQCRDICQPCLLWPCDNGGQCIPKGEKRICICLPPYEPPDCNATEPDLCELNPCKNGGKCKFLPEKDDYICEDCLGKFGGKDCSECNCPKAKRKAGDKRRAVDAICDAVGECACPDGDFTFTSEGCVMGAANPCANKPCKHGTCVVDPSGSGFKCIDCPPPYYGRLCECTTCTCENPCQNGATCQDTGVKQYKCVCPPGYTGPDCSVPITKPGVYCNAQRCEHGGTCVERPHGYDCICTPQYTGPHCGVDKCASCDENADCVYGRCRCRKGYIGTGYVCAEIDKESECGICPVHHHCVRGVCVCMPGFICQEPQCGVCPIHHHCVEGRCVCIPGFVC